MSASHQWRSDALRPFRSAGSRVVPHTRAVVSPVAYHARSSRRSRRSNKRSQQTPEERTDAAVTVRVRRPCPGDLRVGLLGEGGALGKWDTSRVTPLRRSQSDPDLWEWVLAVPIGSKLQFKVVTIDAGDAVVRWSQGNDIVVTVPHGCTGVDVGVEWPEAKGDARDAPLAVQQRVVVEKPIQDYRVETGGAWLAYGKVEKPVDDDDDDDEEEEEEGAGGEDADDKEDPDRVVVDRVDAVDIDAEGGAAKGTAGAFVRADVSADEDDVGVGSSSTDDAPDASSTSSGVDAESQSFSDAFAGGYVVGSHLEGMMGGKHTELVFNAADKETHGVRVGIIEEDRLVELWHEHAAEPGKGMRVGDVYLGVVAKVISGMQGVLVDVTGKGPPYSLMQKGVDEPALAWVQSEEPTWDDDSDWGSWDDEDWDEEGRTTSPPAAARLPARGSLPPPSSRRAPRPGGSVGPRAAGGRTRGQTAWASVAATTAPSSAPETGGTKGTKGTTTIRSRPSTRRSTRSSNDTRRRWRPAVGTPCAPRNARVTPPATATTGVHARSSTRTRGRI